MTETSAPEQATNPLALATVVSRRVEIKDVLLAQSRTFRAPDVGGDQERLDLEYQIDNVEVNPVFDSNRVVVKAGFVLKAVKNRGEEPATSPAFLVEATFVLVYSIHSFDDIDRTHLQAFAATNGVYNAWPYWREFVQSATTRMGLSPAIVPVFRL